MITAFPAKLLFVIFSLYISVSDIRKGAVPRLAFITAFPVFCMICFAQTRFFPPYSALAGSMLGLLIFSAARFITGKKLGLADIWYSSLIGLVLGPVLYLFAAGIACLAGAAVIIIAKKRRIPFIPFMAAGGVIIIFLQGWFL